MTKAAQRLEQQAHLFGIEAARGGQKTKLSHSTTASKQNPACIHTRSFGLHPRPRKCPREAGKLAGWQRKSLVTPKPLL